MSPDPLPLPNDVDEIREGEIEAGAGDCGLTAANVTRGIELGTFDGAAQWALGAIVGRLLCGERIE